MPQVLHLSNKQLSATTGVVVARLLESNTTLRDIHLRNNRLGVKGAVAFARVLERNAGSFTSLSLAANALCGTEPHMCRVHAAQLPRRPVRPRSAPLTRRCPVVRACPQVRRAARQG